MQYFLTYCLGLPAPSGKRAEIGTIVHKVLEGIANVKLATQKGDDGYYDNILHELEARYIQNDGYISALTERSYDYYQPKSIHKWYPRDKKECEELVFKALSQGNGMFDPRKREIVAVEPFFDTMLKEDWATFQWEMPDGSVLTGNLHIKGTIDLILKSSDNLYEVCDWKTGKRKDWATEKEKSYAMLDKDPQLSIYHLATSGLYPDIPNWAMTMNYIAYGGPFTCAYTHEDIIRTLEMLRKQFERIKSCKRPSLRRGQARWFCNRVCHYGKTKHPDSKCGDSICWYLHQKLRRVGMDKLMQEDMHPGFTLGDYQSPGE